MKKDDKATNIKVEHEENDRDELSREELDRLNYERKFRDQQSAGRRITPRHINIVAVVFCVIGLLYAIPRMLLISQDEASDYVPLSERVPVEEEEILPPLPNEQRLYLDDGINTELTTNTTPPPLQSAEPPEEETGAAPASSLGTSRQDIEMLLPESEIINTLEQWARDWSRKNVNGYISHYASSFLSENGQDLPAWREYRAPRMSSPEWIEIEITDLEVEIIDTNNAQADFRQIYDASNYSDESFKRLILVRESGEWKIHRELSVDI